MISRRNFVTIMLMMITLFFMFQFTQVIKLSTNDYKTNEYSAEENLLKDSRNENEVFENYAVYFGSTTNRKYDVVTEWCKINKKSLVACKELKNPDMKEIDGAEIVIVDSQFFDCIADLDELKAIAGSKTPVIFVSVPSTNELKKSAELRKIYGISKILSDEVTAEGLEIFDGFLLGGNTAYKPQKKEEEKYNDLNLTVPWISVGNGTKTFILGMMDENIYTANDFPKLAWKNNYQDNSVFVFVADFIDERLGMGFLSAAEYNISDYSLYPVVNSQNFVVSDFPYVTDENSAKINEKYSRDSLSLSRDIIWPQFVSLSMRNKLKLTAFMNLGYQSAEFNVYKDRVDFYLQQINEIDGEFGRSISCDETYDVREKIAKERDFFGKEGEYRYSAVFSDKTAEENGLLFNDENYSEGICTVVGIDSKAGKKPFEYLNENLIEMDVTNVVDEYTYSKELGHRCNLTALGYSTTLIGMHNLLFSDDTDDEWQNYSKTITGNVSTYWKSNNYFEYTTVSGADANIRKYLNLTYEEERKDNEISIKTSNVSDAFYILRTHNEEIKDIEGGDYIEAEKDVFLIHANEGECIVTLKNSDDILMYNGAGNRKKDEEK